MFTPILFAIAILPKDISHLSARPLTFSSLTPIREPGDSPQFMTINPGACYGGQTVTVTVTGALSSSNQTFQVSSSNGSDFSSIPTYVVLPAGSTQVSFQATTNYVTDLVTIRVYNANGGVSSALTID